MDYASRPAPVKAGGKSRDPSAPPGHFPRNTAPGRASALQRGSSFLKGYRMSIDPWAKDRCTEAPGHVRRPLSLRGIRDRVRRLFRSPAPPRRHTWVPVVDIAERPGDTLIQVKSSAVDPADIQIR